METKATPADNGGENQESKTVQLECVTGIRLHSGEKVVSMESGKVFTAKVPYSEQVAELIAAGAVRPYVKKETVEEILVKKSPEEKYICLSRIRYNGQVYTKGMPFPKDASDEIVKELKQVGAIKEL